MTEIVDVDAFDSAVAVALCLRLFEEGLLLLPAAEKA